MFDYTITIVAYRNYNDILEAIASLDKYTSKDITKQMYIIDNSCYDNSIQEKIEFLKELKTYTFVEYIDTGSNLGFGAAHNYNIDKLDSHLHIIMNPDIIIFEDSLKQIKEFMKDNNIGMCVPRLLDENGNIQWVYRRELTVFDLFVRMFASNVFKKRYAYHTMMEQDYSKPFQVPFAQGSFLVIRTDLYRKLKGFDDRFFMYMEDADLCKRVNNISSLVYDPYTSVIHKWERGSHKDKRLLKIHLKSMKAYFSKWGIKIV